MATTLATLRDGIVRCPHHRTRHHAGCPGCQRYAREIARTRHRAKAYGMFESRQPAGPVRDHIEALHAAGMTWNQISRESQISKQTLDELRAGRRANVAASTARALLAVAAVESTPAGYVDATGTCRRVRALYALGHTLTVQCGWYGTCTAVLDRWLYGRVTWVSQQSADTVRRVYEQESMREAEPTYGANRARLRAARKGWLPPTAWDDDTIDDPATAPRQPGTGDGDDVSDLLDTQVRVDRAVHGQLPYEQMNRTERRLAVRRLNRAGLNDAEAARVLRSTTDTVGRRRMRMGLPNNFLPTSNYSRSA